ncbi:dnaJ homolog subfamily C member 1 [Genypterus blacodes]|uniref:dnaJ homolog subfamily C member 1 n=1 Tax=Genypterus blacodes TaxID=154954 RepID=UPI003F75ABEB
MDAESARPNRAAPAPCRTFVVVLGVLLCGVPSLEAWDADLELLDLVEEFPQNFYEFMSVEQDASSPDIKKAYRRLSLTLHPDKNKDENAETQFRQLVAIYEVLKDEERRQKYDDILVNGLPDWRQPVFYYRRVRKMSNTELAFLLFLILTVGHYAIIWSIYLEKQLDELLSKKKKEKKKKLSSRPIDEFRCMGQDRKDRPQWQDILPLKLSIWLYLSIKNLPQTIQEVKLFYEQHQQMKEQQQREEAEAEAEAEQEAAAREKRTKVKKPKVEFPVYESLSERLNHQSYEQSTSIEEIEDQMDDWLQDHTAAKKKAADWSDDELSLLSRLMVKFPGGMPGRWEKIAHELGRSVSDVTTKVKQVKDNVSSTAGLVKLSELKGCSAPSKLSLLVPDSLMTQREVGASMEGGAMEEQLQEEEGEEDEAVVAVRQRNRKVALSDGGEVRVRGRRQRDFDPVAALEDEGTEPQRVEGGVWTQNQQKLLEVSLQQFPRGTAERWDRIAKGVPGKTKEDCMIRYKMLAELVQKKKQAKS